MLKANIKVNKTKKRLEEPKRRGVLYLNPLPRRKGIRSYILEDP